MNPENKPQPNEPQVLPPTLQAPTSQTQPPVPPPANKKRLILVIIPIVLILLIGSGVAYALLVHIPNKPENVFKKAVLNLSEGGNYTVKGRLDQGHGNAPDFNYEIKTNHADFSAKVDASTYVMSPSMEILRVDGKTYINPSNWLNKAELAARYSNATGSKTIQEYLSEFAENSGLHAKQGSWIQLDEWALSSPATTYQSLPESDEDTGISMQSFGEIEDRDGKQIRNYKVKLSQDGFTRLLGALDNSLILMNIFKEYSRENGFPDSVSMSVDIDVKSKSVQKISYDGRPFKDATLSMELVAANNSFDVPANATLASKTLRPGIVWSKLFNPAFERGESARDRERIADLKGIKMALEIHKSLHGEYPGRMDIATNGENYLRQRLSGTDPEVFKDPNGRFIGMHGSQYAYVAYTSNDSELCGPNNGAKCEKYFIATTLDSGEEHKLTSD